MIPFNPVISVADVSVGNITLGTARTLTIVNNRVLTVSGTFTMGGGDVDATAGLVRLTQTGTFARTSGILLGNAEKGYTAPTDDTFPVGTPAAYSPARMNVTAVATVPSTMRVRVTAGTAPTVADATTLDRYWTFTETGDVTMSFTLTYLQTDVDGNEAIYKTLRRRAASA